MAKCTECKGSGKVTLIVGDGYGVQHLKKKRVKCRACKGTGTQPTEGKDG